MNEKQKKYEIPCSNRGLMLHRVASEFPLPDGSFSNPKSTQKQTQSIKRKSYTKITNKN